MQADEVIDLLDLQPLPLEGGYYRETFRDDNTMSTPAGPRSTSTAIYYFLTPDTFSAFHRLQGSEVYHFYLGDPVELWTLDTGEPQHVILGPDIANGQHLQWVIPARKWQGSRLARGGAWALLGTTMAPGFDFDDYEHADRETLLAEYPDHRTIIEALTR